MISRRFQSFRRADRRPIPQQAQINDGLRVQVLDVQDKRRAVPPAIRASCKGQGKRRRINEDHIRLRPLAPGKGKRQPER